MTARDVSRVSGSELCASRLFPGSYTISLDTHGMCAGSAANSSSRRRQIPRFDSLMRKGVSGGREAGAWEDAPERSPASSPSNTPRGMAWRLCLGNEVDVQGESGGVARAMCALGVVQVDSSISTLKLVECEIIAGLPKVGVFAAEIDEDTSLYTESGS